MSFLLGIVIGWLARGALAVAADRIRDQNARSRRP